MPRATYETANAEYLLPTRRFPMTGRGRAVAVSSMAPNKPNVLRFWAENEDRVRNQSQSKPIWAGRDPMEELVPARAVRAVAVASMAPNKANFPCFGPENEDRAEKQSQFPPAGAGVASPSRSKAQAWGWRTWPGYAQHRRGGPLCLPVSSKAVGRWALQTRATTVDCPYSRRRGAAQGFCFIPLPAGAKILVFTFTNGFHG